MGVTSPSATELTVHIKVARDAAPGVASLYVINPDDSEAEAAFEVTGKGAATPAIPPSPSSPPPPGSTDTQRYDAFHLGNPTEATQVHGKVKGSLVVSSGTIKYEEDGKTLINISVERNQGDQNLFGCYGHVPYHHDFGKDLSFCPGVLTSFRRPEYRGFASHGLAPLRGRVDRTRSTGGPSPRPLAGPDFDQRAGGYRTPQPGALTTLSTEAQGLREKASPYFCALRIFHMVPTKIISCEALGTPQASSTLW